MAYYLKKELINCSTEFGLSNTSTVDELWKLLDIFLQEEGENESLRDRVTDLCLRHAKLSVITAQECQLVYPQLPNSSVMDRARKWGVVVVAVR